MVDVPNTRLINFVDTPASVSYNMSGEAFVPLDPQTGSTIDITGFRRASVRIGSAKASSFAVFMGKISGATLAERINQPIDDKIHTFDVAGPQMNLLLAGGPPKYKDKVQLWVYLRS